MYAHPDTKNECLGIKFDDDNNDEFDETKRKTRNLSEKKRRDQFNTLINELNNVVSPTSRKMDKSTVLKTAINNLNSYNENVVRSKEFELDEDFKPSFITNEEYLFLLLQSINGFLIIFDSCGKILYSSDNLAFVLGYQLSEVLNTNIYDMISEDDRSHLENLFFVSNDVNNHDYTKNEGDDPLHFNCKLMKKSASFAEGSYEPVEFIGNIKTQKIPSASRAESAVQVSNKSSIMFVGLARLLSPIRYPEISILDHVETEFVSHHNSEWKFIFLDERAPSIIGYSSFEVLGRSGYDYYHVDDLENICTHHKTLVTQDKGVSGYYRFLTKGCEWIWLQTTSYVNRRQWNSRVEFIVCTHKVVNPLTLKNEMEAEVSRSNRSTTLLSSSGAGSTTGSSGSNKMSSPSWHSATTSESNYCEENDPLQWTCEGSYPDDCSISSSTSSRDCLNAKYKAVRKYNRQHRSLRKAYTTTSSDCSSSNPYCFRYNNNFANTPPMDETATSSDCKQYHNLTASCGMEESGYSRSALEHSLQKKCNELQQIIADRTEELRIVSEQLNTARKANQQKSDVQYNSSLNDPVIAEENDSSTVTRHFANLSNLCPSVTGTY